jgi:UDP-N-acetylglucosamine transferase subunit ALG13
MKIFVTVGTTSFNSLIRFIDESFDKKQYEIIFQIAEGKFHPENFQYFKFSGNIEQYYTDCDIVITHAGAGSIYRLLELKKKIIIVPNLERIDKHQIEIAEYMKEKEHALVCMELIELQSVINRIMNTELKEFKREDFFAHFQINEMIKQLYTVCDHRG